MNSNSRYDAYFAKKAADKSGVEMLPGSEVGPGAAQRDWLGNSNLTQNEEIEAPSAASISPSSAGDIAKATQQGGVESGISTALMASGNPYAMGAGLGLQTLGAMKKGENERIQNRYADEIKKINARQSAINKLAQIGQGLKA
jgi:hypothetical protein